jgi:hypothetical protein
MRSRVAVTIIVLLAILALVVFPSACTDSDTTTTSPSITTTTTSPVTTTTSTAPTQTTTTTTTTTETPVETVTPAHPEVNRTTPDELKNMLDTMTVNTDFVILDTRDGGSYSDAHIQGAINITYSSGGDPFEREMMYMVLPMSKPIVIYCT